MELVHATCASRAGYVYILRERGNPNNFFKVGGTTRSAQARIGDIQIGNPRTLEAVVQYGVRNCYAAETAVHTALRTNRNWQYVGHEWYSVQPNQFNAFQNTVRNTAGNNEVAEQVVNDIDDVEDEKNLVKLIKSLLA